MSFYSGVSDFNSASPYGAFWQIGSTSDPEHIVVCATNGFTFVSNLQSLLSSVPSGSTYDGSTVSGSMVRVDGRLGATTAKALWLAARNAGADAATLAQIQREAHGRGSVGMTQILKTAIQLMNAPPSLSLTVRLPEGASLIPPVWGTMPPIPTGWDFGAPAGMDMVHCTEPYSRDGAGYYVLMPGETADPSAPPAPPPPSPEVPPPPPAPEHGGPPIPPAPSPATEDVPLPPGRSPMAVVQEGISWGPVLIIGGLIFAAVLFAGEFRPKSTVVQHAVIPERGPKVNRKRSAPGGR